MTIAATQPGTGAASRDSLFTNERKIGVARIVLCGVLIFSFTREWVPIGVLWAAVAVGLYPLARTGLKDLVGEHRVGTEVFVTIATLVAVAGGEAVAGSVLMAIILFAELIADFNTDRARASIRGLLGSVPTTARRRIGNRDEVVGIDQLAPGDIVLVPAGDRIPVDGTVVGGAGAIDESPVTGESVPKDKTTGAEVYAGTILQSGALDVEVRLVGAETTFARIIALVEEAEENRAPVQKLADRVATWLIPFMFLFLIVVFLITRDVRKVVTLMIFTSPAELGLATPMVMIAAIARAARAGILVKGGNYLEALAHVDTVVFDKTGTLTIGQPTVQRVEPADPATDENTLLALAATADRRSAHPLAQAVVDAANQRGLQVGEPETFEVVQGRGVIAGIGGATVLVGNAALLTDNALTIPERVEDSTGDDAYTDIHVAADGRYLGRIRLADELRPGAADAIAQLRATGIRHVGMLTGDNPATAAAIAAKLGIDEVRAQLLPADKVDAITELQRAGRRVAMVGDGINDAPALAAADVGLAMAVRGTQAALEAADIALMTDSLDRIVAARTIARRAYRTIKENLYFGVGVVHVAGITAALFGIIGPVQAAFIHLGPDVAVFVNSTKLLRIRLDPPATPNRARPGLRPRAEVALQSVPGHGCHAMNEPKAAG